MKPEIHNVVDPETGATSVLVNGVEFMRVNADLTIEAYRPVFGSTELSEIVLLRTKDYMDWLTSKAAETPDLPSALLA